jgi:hypothetical protein
MTIDWITDGPVTTTLCHGTERGVNKATGPSFLSVEDTPNTQISPRIRAASADVFDRGNRVFVVSFGATRQYADYEAALEDFNLHGKNLVRSGLLRITLGDLVVEYGDAVIAITARRQLGIVITWTYQITASTVVKVEEEEP